MMGASGEKAMPRGSDLLGLPVIAATGGQALGRVQDLVLDPAATRVVGLLLDRGGWLRSPRTLPWPAVGGVADAVVANHTPVPGAAPGLTWRELAGKPVLTPGGDELGLLTDLWLGSNGMIAGYQLSCGLIDDLLSGQPVLRAPLQLAVGEAVAFIVPAGETDGGGISGAVPELQ